MRIERFSKGNKYYFRFLGVDFGADLLIIEEREKYLLAQVKGHTAWIALGTFKYQSPKLIIFEKINDVIENFQGVKRWEYTKETRKETFKEALEYFMNLVYERIKNG